MTNWKESSNRRLLLIKEYTEKFSHIYIKIYILIQSCEDKHLNLRLVFWSSQLDIIDF